MHHLDLGLYNHQITFTCDFLKSKYEHLILDKIDNRLANIPRHSGLKIFKNGIQTANIANEYQNLIKIMIFVLDDLTEDNDLNKILIKVYKDWNNMYLIIRYEESWAKQFVNIFQEFSSSRLKFPKLQLWVYYTTDLIKKYGPLNRFSTETYESLHKDFVKSPYYLTNKKDIEIQILKMIQRQDIVTKLSAKSNQNAKIIYSFKFNNLI
ncbi:zn-finger domain-containing protein [Gigaspora margarita]|uniref:Zn-finger domain-containing protein n=1 Tax=Gigaspora margarita TaxID=4874 RepID=A0A8H4A3H1_GIGMA|nr:zn-finger domain-containing protein [Gigaspora margarita]